MEIKKDNLNKNIFILGGAGYVGAELVKFLLSQGYRVTVFDLFIYFCLEH